MRYFITLEKAWNLFLSDDQWWKISWSTPGKKRVRIVKSFSYGVLFLQGGYVEDILQEEVKKYGKA